MIEPAPPAPEPTAKQMLHVAQAQDLKAIDEILGNPDFQRLFLDEVKKELASAESKLRNRDLHGLDLEAAREHWLTLGEIADLLDTKRLMLKKALDSRAASDTGV